MTTVSIYYDIKDLFNKDKLKSIEDEFSCPICGDIIYKQEWYQCNQGHVGCSNCWDIIINSTQECSSCKAPVKSFTDGLSRCRHIEQLFAKKKICCPYSFKDNIMNNKENKIEYDLDNDTVEYDLENDKIEQEHDLDNGCKDKIKVEQLEDHQKNCNSRFVKCNNHGCDYVSRYNQYLKHENECQHAIIECEKCGSEMKRPSLADHQQSCQSIIVTCTQCSVELKRPELQDHINNKCPNTIIQCKFQPYGCKDEFKRSELSNHLEQVNHTTHMLQLIKDQSKQLDDQSKQLDEYKKELQESNKKCNDILNKFTMTNVTSYSNTWIISNFMHRTGADKNSIYSPIINLQPFKFTLSTSYSNNIPNYYLWVKDLKRNGGTIKIKFTFKLLNYKDSKKNLVNTIEENFVINAAGWGSGFNDVEYSLESGYVFPDGSVKLEFTIDFEKQVLTS